MDRVLTEKRGNWRGVAAWLGAAATVAACGGQALNVGKDVPVAAGGTSSGGSVNGVGTGGVVSGGGGGGRRLSAEELYPIQWPADETCTPAPGSKLMGSWRGHWPERNLGFGAEAEMVLTIAGLTPDGVPCGTVTIGEGPQPPPVQDPDSIYPPSFGAGGGVGVFTNLSLGPWLGFAYRMLHVTSTDTRLSFLITFNQILRPWCQQQPAYQESFSCLPPWTQSVPGPGDNCKISGPNLPQTTVPCFKTEYCSAPNCFCYDGACDAGLKGQAVFELHWDDAALEGTVDTSNLIFLDPVAR